MAKSVATQSAAKKSTGTSGSRKLARVLKEARGCTLCATHLPLGPKPVLRASVTARLLIVGQAPGTKVHASGIPWNDPSGDTLRHWLALDRERFYDDSRVAIVPIGLCYPGRMANGGGDSPPRPECAPRWHPALRALMPEITVTLLIGAYAQAYYLGARRKRTLAETVQAWRDYGPYIPMPHPSPRNRLWLRKHPWFEAETVPAVRRRIAAALRRTG